MSSVVKLKSNGKNHTPKNGVGPETEERRYQRRLEKFTAKGVPEDKAREIIALEDFNSLPLDQKIALLTRGEMSRYLKSVQLDINNIVSAVNNLALGQRNMAEVLNLNNLALQKVFKTLRVTEDDLKKAVEEAQQEINDERAKALEAAKTKKTQEPIETPIKT